MKIVLGNHDLNLLGIAAGYRKHGHSDTLKAILEAPDRDILLEWLRQQPLLHHDPDLKYTMVHAGIPPQWSLQQAIDYSNEITCLLRGPKICQYLKHMYGEKPDTWNDSLEGPKRWRLITNYFTRMRFCSAAGKLDLHIKSGVASAPKGYRPWYAHENRLTHDDRIIFGHWAALGGDAEHENVYAIDTGYVWGGKLTMMRLEDQAFFYAEN